MQVKTNKLPKNLMELTIKVSQDELKPYLEQAAAKISKDFNIPGFRPGKASYGLVKQRVGEMKIYQEMVEFAIPKTYGLAILEQKLITLGPPKIEVQKLAPANPLIYKAIVILLPEIKLGNYKGFKIQKKEIKVEEKDVQETVKNIQKIFAKEKRVSRKAKMGDKVEIDLDTYLNKIPIDQGQSKSHPIVLGEGHFVPGFEENLIGLAEGETKEFTVKFPKDYHRQDLAGKHVEFKASARSVYEIELPPADDNLAKQLGQFEKFSDLQKQIEQNILQDKKLKEKQGWEVACLEKIMEKSKFEEIPEMLIESESHKMMHELENDVQKQGMKFDDYLTSLKKSKEDLQREFRPNAEKRIKTALIIRKIAEAENIKVADDELKKELAKQLEQYKNNPEVTKQINTEEYRDYLRNIMASQKVFEFLERVNS